MRCWYAVVSSKSSSYRIRVTRHSWPSPWRYGGLQPLLHLAMSPHGTDGPSRIQKAAAGIAARHYLSSSNSAFFASPARLHWSALARKNGKSQVAAALALCHLCGPEAENRGEVYSCANDRFQPGRIFNDRRSVTG